MGDPGVTIEFSSLTKTFGGFAAVNDISFSVKPGRVTGFLGPNGAGKTTSLRTLLGLVNPTSGSATFGGTRYRDLPTPLTTVGAALEAASFHPGRSARHHLEIYARAAGLPLARAREVLTLVGLDPFVDKRVGGYSLGMRQRLGLAYAMLGDPRVLVLDEPVNGLDPEGIKWIRELLRGLAAEGRTVLISSHLLSEVQQTVDDVVIISKGEIVHEGTLADLDTGDQLRVHVDSPDRAALQAALESAGFAFDVSRTGFIVRDVEPGAVGHAAFVSGVELHVLQRKSSGLEERFLSIVGGGDVA
ncbi:ABC transporter ATP-binding protein [Paramicrobacterium agarici]|uniref:ABC-2 type transport system ATP-binding protein n=1 Tax=Paramicrobacterium agarici TaxID=630514 RepID=A0A2A9DU83_9MICO|nr:ABC transporter ATP-binding protein [Microbacterium agarici]PFG29480.1 ABC-2 type transport system ATP-binding protein [Microbacterium agarici]TQO22485.1 ABC-2 type transport system ATP-binding protein [Microbacterium agarici]